MAHNRTLEDIGANMHIVTPEERAEKFGGGKYTHLYPQKLPY